MSDTPETDAPIPTGVDPFACMAARARNLERQRNEACCENEEMRTAIKEASAALGGCLKYILKLPLSGSDAECETVDDAHHALRKLKPFLK